MMPLALSLAVTVTAASPAPAVVAAPERVLVLETRADEAYLARVRAFGDLLATILERRTQAEIVPSSSVKDRLAMAADKLAAGCDDTTCMSEIAGALDARWVVASPASQVGGRWLMRVELFDSENLKVVAQASAMSDGVEGLAAQAETLAEQLLAKAPMLAQRAAPAASEPAPELPPPDARTGGSATPWVVGGLAGAGAVAAALVGTLSFVAATGAQATLDDATKAYLADPGPDTRAALAAAGEDGDNVTLVHNCLLLPVGCLALPLAGVAIGGVWWGATDDGEEAAP